MKTINKLAVFTVALFAAIILWGCDIHKNNNVGPDMTPPDPPTGISVLNGDNVVDIYWNANSERDIAGYNVYYSNTYNGKYKLLGSTKNTHFTDNGAQNGVTTYYAVSAYDYDDNESELSYDNAYATPRPEGFNKVIYDYRRFPDLAGFGFANSEVLPYQDKNTDVFFDNDQGTFYLVVWDEFDIQDMGPTKDIYDIPFAPTKGWSSSKDALAIIGHTYVIWTVDNHYAKIRVTNITNERITFDWAYQTVEGNPELKTTRISAERKSHDNLELQKLLELRAKSAVK